jgi:ribonuclease J
MLVRATAQFRPYLEQYRDNCKIVYSMWSGYLSGKAKNQNYIDFLDGFDYEILHASGHATPATMRAVCDTVDPRCGIIPIHSQAPEKFKTLFPNRNVMLLEDGQKLEL